jgi:hypothetical protein
MMADLHFENRWFWAWQDEQEEKWLEEMSERGFHLVKPGTFGRYAFRKGEPKRCVYRLDFLANSQQKEDYLQLFADAGWEYVGEFGSWQYFRKPAGDQENVEIFTDVTSKIEKYQRVLLFLVILTPVYLMPIYFRAILDWSPHWLMFAIFVVWFVVLCLDIFAMIRLIQRISQLKDTLKQ